MSEVRIKVWYCDECGYWRQDESTGVHQTWDRANPRNPRGRLVLHPLRQVEFVADTGRSPEEVPPLAVRQEDDRP